ncbi:MAG: chemotaxis protein MotB [Rhodobacterales bacterium]|nr:MAG: chemotaxis protein MotB [Rhodobacterales bacterium]
MSATANAPIIIKRKKIVAGGGHHGGAWKVAYADFVTAMMAFFMLMWLLNATTEQQRKGIADYFSPTIPLAKISGGGSGLLNGQDAATREKIYREAEGASTDNPNPRNSTSRDDEDLARIEEALAGTGGESTVADDTLRHIVTRTTDEGLVIELFDIGDTRIFAPGTAESEPLAHQLAAMLVRVIATVENDVAVRAHVRAFPAPLAQEKTWPLSMERADVFRRLLDQHGLEDGRVTRTTGRAATSPIVLDPMALRNNRVEIVLLRQGR